MNDYKKQKNKMEKSLLKVAMFAVSAADIIDRTNYQESLYILSKMIDKLRRDSTYLV